MDHEDAGPKLSIKGGNPPPGRSFDLTDAATGFVGGGGGGAVGAGGADAGMVADAGVFVSPFDPSAPLVEAGCEAALPTGFCFVSPDGDYIGGGASVDISGETGLITGDGTAGEVTFTAEAAGAGSWRLVLAAAERGHLAPGDYPLAERVPFMDFGAAGVSLSGEGRGCNMLSGAFSVTEAEFDHDGQLVRFAARFEQSCEGTGPALRGAINFAANGVAERATGDPDDCPVPLPTGFCFASQAGDGIGAGATIWQSPADGTLEVMLDDATLSVAFEGGDSWHLEVDGPDGAPLALGAHEDATRFPFNSPTSNGLSVSGAGRGCNMLFGRFDVLELETDPDDGSLVRAAIDLEQHCDAESAPALFGKIRFESTLE